MSDLGRFGLHMPDGSERPSGLWVPAETLTQVMPDNIPPNTLLVIGKPPSDLDAVGVAVDPEALGADPVSLEQIEHLLAGLPFERTMVALSTFAAGAWFAHADQQRHLRMAEELFGGHPGFLDQLRRFVEEDRQHVIFSEQNVAVLMRLLICGEATGEGTDQLTASEADSLLTALIGIASHTARQSDPVTDPKDPTSWVPWLVRSGLYFDQSNLGSDQGRARSLFLELAAEADRDGPNWCDLPAWLDEDIASFQAQLGFGYAIGAFTNSLDADLGLADRLVVIRREGLLEGQFDPDLTERLVAATSASRRELVDRFEEAGTSDDHMLWDRAPFEQRPLLRLADGRLALLSPRFLHAWMGEGIYYRLLDSARKRKPPSGRSQTAAPRFTRFHGELTERYVVRLSEESHVDQIASGLAVLAGDRTYAGADGTESRSPDLTISFTTDLVAIEVSGGRPTRRARILSEPAAMLETIDRVIEKLKELDAALGDILGGRVEIDGVDIGLLERVWPVVVVPSTILQNEWLWQHIEARAPELGSDRRVQHPTLFSIEDYEMALGLVEQGNGLPQLLHGRLDSFYATMPPSHFFARNYPNARRPRYLEGQMRASGDEAFETLFSKKRSDHRPAE